MFSMLNSKEGCSLALLILLASIGFQQLKVKPQSRSFRNQYSANVAAEQTLEAAGRVNVRPIGADTDLFQHFQDTAAAELISLQPLNRSEWLASFQYPVLNKQKVPALERQRRGWFETEERESPKTLPLVKTYRALNGEVRVEDASSGATLFAYQASATFKPVAVVKVSEHEGAVWQVVFSDQPGMLSQTARR